jgi:hypothetical protein
LFTLAELEDEDVNRDACTKRLAGRNSLHRGTRDAVEMDGRGASTEAYLATAPRGAARANARFESISEVCDAHAAKSKQHVSTPLSPCDL